MKHLLTLCHQFPPCIGPVPSWAQNKSKSSRGPRPNPGQLLIKVGANALCGSERPQFFDGTPTTPGHEATGTVVAVGPDIRTAVGTPGAVFLMDFCGKCRSCKLGFTNQCLTKRGDMGFNRDGGYGQYQLLNENIFSPPRGLLRRKPRFCWISWARAGTRSNVAS